MVWELSEDTPDGVLLAAIKAGLTETTTPYPAPARLPAPDMSARLGFESAKAWTVYGDGVTGKLMPDAKVSGGQVLRVTLSHPTENTWDIGASTPVAEALKANVTIGFAVWARLNTADRDAQLDIPVAVQLATSPYTPIIQGHVTVTSSWQLLYITGTPSAEYPPGSANAALSLGSAAKVIDLGPAFMFRVELSMDGEWVSTSL